MEPKRLTPKEVRTLLQDRTEPLYLRLHPKRQKRVSDDLERVTLYELKNLSEKKYSYGYYTLGPKTAAFAPHSILSKYYLAGQEVGRDCYQVPESEFLALTEQIEDRIPGARECSYQHHLVHITFESSVRDLDKWRYSSEEELQHWWGLIPNDRALELFHQCRSGITTDEIEEND